MGRVASYCPSSTIQHPESSLLVYAQELEGIWTAFRPFFERPQPASPDQPAPAAIKKVWHNYSFDRHVMGNAGLQCQGFEGDTMHMARLWNSSRKGKVNYSLESLSG